MDYSTERKVPDVPACGPAESSLHFNGAALLLRGKKTKSYPAVSGLDGKYEPIPEGRYWINPSELWERSGWTDVKLYVVGAFKQGASGQQFIRDHQAGWGNYRITLHPFPETNVGSRGGFFIHGGTRPGSKGCIDLTEHMAEFVRDIRSEAEVQKDCFFLLTVKYLPAQI